MAAGDHCSKEPGCPLRACSEKLMSYLFTMRARATHVKVPARKAFAAAWSLAAAGAFAQPATQSQFPDQPTSEAKAVAPNSQLDEITVSSGRPSSLPLGIPASTEGIDAQKIEQTINAVDSSDALKYLPSLNVRKRNIGDYDHAVLASRASGTGNSARSLVYADGILLSNLLGNGASFTPRWGMVSPSEIDRVDVLYGPFAAIYPGNSMGAVVEYLTKMPSSFVGQAAISGVVQKFSEYGTRSSYSGAQSSASLGSRSGNFAWWFNVNHLDTAGQPLVFPNRLVSAGVASSSGLAVTGAIPDKSPQNLDRWILGATSQTQTVQDQAKLKLSYDLSPSLTASYLFGLWRNDAERASQSYLRDGAGQEVYSGNINIAGRQYALNVADFAPSTASLQHVMQGLSLKTKTRGNFEAFMSWSQYQYQTDLVRAPVTALPTALNGGAGRVTDQSGSGWESFALAMVWHPQGPRGPHSLEFGLQKDQFNLKTVVSDTGDWLHGAAQSAVSVFKGNTSLTSLYLQDTWRLYPEFKLIAGLRAEQWEGFGAQVGAGTTLLSLANRKENHLSPKLSVLYSPKQEQGDWSLRASFGRAVRMPTASELYQGTVSANALVNNDPLLKPERALSTELSFERYLEKGLWRATVFHEETIDALYAQTNTSVTPTITNIQNVDRVRSLGFELAYQANDVFVRGLAITSSLTYLDSIILRNDKFPASVGQWQPRVPRWRASLVASYAPSQVWSFTYAMRYSGQQFGNLDNSDVNGKTYLGFSNYLVADLRMRYKFNKNMSGSLGIDNLNNNSYWAFHPYPQRSLVAELRFVN
jgi:iron complex outermembrane recepter protein